MTISSATYIFRERRDAALALLTPLVGTHAAALAVSVLELSHRTDQRACWDAIVSCGVDRDEAMPVLRALGYATAQPTRCHRCRKEIGPNDRACFGRGEDAGKAWCGVDHWRDEMRLQQETT